MTPSTNSSSNPVLCTIGSQLIATILGTIRPNFSTIRIATFEEDSSLSADSRLQWTSDSSGFPDFSLCI